MKNRNYLVIILVFISCLSCTNNNSGKDINKTTPDPLILKGMIIVNEDGQSYFTSQGWLGGGGKSDILYVIHNVEYVASAISNNERISKFKDKDLSFTDVELGTKKAKVFYSKMGISCNCGGGISLTSTSNSKDCGTLCNEAIAVIDAVLNK